MKLQFNAAEVAELLCQALSQQIALGQITGAVVTSNGATVYVNEEPDFEEIEVEDEDTEEVEDTPEVSATPKKRRRRRTKAQMQAAKQEAVATEPEEKSVDTNDQLELPLVEETIDEHLDEVNPEEPVITEEPMTVAEIDANDPFAEEPKVDTSTDVFADDDEDPFA